MHTAIFARFSTKEEAQDVVLNGECKIGIVSVADQTCLIHATQDIDLVLGLLADFLFGLSVYMETSIVQEKTSVTILRIAAHIDDIERALKK